PGEAHVDRYRHVASLMVRGFHYGGLMSRASVDPESGDELSERSLEGRAFPLAKLDYLADADVFLGHNWILGRDDLRDVYPYHVHLKNFIKVFRRQYGLEWGRL
ncbi:hypothetical protein ACFL6C_11255, partial [Myxococcota bacterium]